MGQFANSFCEDGGIGVTWTKMVGDFLSWDLNPAQIISLGSKDFYFGLDKQRLRLYLSRIERRIPKG